MKNARLKKWIKILGFLLLIGTLYISIIAVSIINYSKVDETQQADAAVILGAGLIDNAPSAVFKSRIDHGIWLYKNGYVKKIIMTGGMGKGSYVSDSQVAKEYASAKGVPKADILIEEKSTITQQNIKYAAEIIYERGIDKVLIVSDPLHMKRAMRMAKDFKLNAYPSPAKNTMYRTLKTKIPFLAREVFFYIGYPVVDNIFLEINHR